ncbi:MAG: bifunctional phosphopantothenoylcysteine decarboxylase/phosphopantothenate--cysteine ligase CoaBC [Candidatus Heimdallarchaeota archaeon]|nr:bifunctional phosphopantothenoylcysteine decarboxylase/phosphopantothenate--cysteine ligase CoaBC [Candidatus Heimdallarchaeota archaeon]
MFNADFRHPSTRILGSNCSRLKGKRIVLGVTGSVASFLSPMIARELIRLGATVIPVMSKEATRFIGKDLMWWATGIEPIMQVTGKLEHISLAGVMNDPVDLMLITPTTTNTVAKLAAGIADTPVTLIASSLNGKGIPIMILCVAHEDLINSPAIKAGLNTLRGWGIHIIEPQMSEGKAKAPEISDIIFEAVDVLTEKNLVGSHVIVTGGPTREYLDQVRFISNASSGLTGIELAKEAQLQGAEVKLVMGPSSLHIPRGLDKIDVQSTQEMTDEVLRILMKHPDSIVILSAAMADFKAKQISKGKIKSGSERSFELVPTIKLSDQIKKNFPNSKLVVFKAEWNITKTELTKRAKAKLVKTKADLVIANDLSNPEGGFESDKNSIIVINEDGVVAGYRDFKANLVMKIISHTKDLI